MKTILFLAAAVLVFLALKHFVFGGRVNLREIQEKLSRGEAVLVDVREPSEWASGVAEPALLLPLSDLRGGCEKWAPQLARHKDKEWFLYCASGMRSSVAAGILRRDGVRAVNAGTYGAWRSAGLPVKPQG